MRAGIAGMLRSGRDAAVAALSLLMLLASLWIASRSAAHAGETQGPILNCSTGVFSDSARRGSAGLTGHRWILRSRFVNVDFDLVARSAGPRERPSGAGAPLPLNLFHGTCYMAVLERAEGKPPAKFTWTGRVQGVAGSRVILVVEDGVMAAHITVAGRVFEVRSLGNGVHAVEEIEQAAFGPD